MHDLLSKQHTVVSHRSPPAPLISMLLTHKGHAGFRSFAHVPFLTILGLINIKIQGWQGRLAEEN